MTFSVEDALSTAGDSLEVAASMLWNLDSNRLNPTTDYRLDLQHRKAHRNDDAASYPLFEHLSEDVWSRPTYGLFKKLLDNYTAETGIPERLSQDELQEELQFLDAISETACIQFVYEWLNINTDLGIESMEEFLRYLKHNWFDFYSRDGARDSSGFEHVFCGELDDGQVKGLHNFVQVYVEECRGNFNYRGFLNTKGEYGDEAPPSTQQMITIGFDWLQETKPVSSMFVGVSPEFEVALYTLLFAGGVEELEVELGPYLAKIKVYKMAGKIGTAFPCLLGVDYDKLESEGMVSTSQINVDNGPPPGEDEFPALGSAPEPTEQTLSYAQAVQEGENEEEGQEGDDNDHYRRYY